MSHLFNIPLMIAMPGPMELLLILLIVLLVFGATRLPQIFRSLGSGMHEFKKGLNEGEKGNKDAKDKKDGHDHDHDGGKCCH